MQAVQTIRSVRRCLSQLVCFTAQCEDVILWAHQKRPAGIVAYSTIVAQRRLAQAVYHLGTEGAYEARLILRAMMEHHYNLSWILLKEPHRRANRFLKFQSVEKARALEGFPREMRPPNYDALHRTALVDRARVRHLFARPNKSGGLTWDKNWARGKSFELRLREVKLAEVQTPEGPDMFMYTLYRWLSGAVHGSATHFQGLLESTKYGVRPKANPVLQPANQMMGANLLLSGTLGKASGVLGFSPGMCEQLSRISQKSRKLVEDQWDVEVPPP